VVPTGGCLTLVALVLLGFGALFFGITSAVSDSTAYTEAMKRTTENEYIIEVLGEPIEVNGMGHKSINYSNGIKTVEFSEPIKGPKGKGLLKVIGEGVDNTWKYSQMDVFISDRDTVVNLLQQALSNDF
jgi:hypothetical protein